MDWGDLCRIKSDGQWWLPSACPLQAGASVYQQHNSSVMDHPDLLLRAGQTLYVMSNIHNSQNQSCCKQYHFTLKYQMKSTNFLPQIWWFYNLYHAWPLSSKMSKCPAHNVSIIIYLITMIGIGMDLCGHYFKTKHEFVSMSQTLWR